MSSLPQQQVKRLNGVSEAVWEYVKPQGQYQEAHYRVCAQAARVLCQNALQGQNVRYRIDFRPKDRNRLQRKLKKIEDGKSKEKEGKWRKKGKKTYRPHEEDDKTEGIEGVSETYDFREENDR
jgi:hypothetical protein